MAGTGTSHLRDRPKLLAVDGVRVRYRLASGRRLEAVSDVSIDVLPGETLGLVGESGCGKSSLARAIAALPPPAKGSVVYDGQPLSRLRGRQLRRLRATIGMVFQDPVSSLNPHRTVRQIVEDPLRVWRVGNAESRAKRVDELLQSVGVDANRSGDAFPRQFSGGQCQRVSIARALALRPKLLICDEPVSALDVSIQAGVLNLLEALKADYNLSMLFVSHDLAVVKNISDRVAVMYLGRLCEVAPSQAIYRRVAHPFSAALMDAIPRPDRASSPDTTLDTTPDRRTPSPLHGDVPSPLNPPSGCRFHTRCPRAEARCRTHVPTMRPLADDPAHHVACHFPLLPVVNEPALPYSQPSV